MGMDKILFKVLTRAYYRQNTGFFLVLVLACFGFLRNEDHLALASQAMVSPWFLVLFYFGFWAIFMVKASLFVVKSIHHPRNEFLFLLRLLPPKDQFLSLLVVQFGLLVPILAYAVFMSAFAIGSGYLFVPALIGGFFLILLVVPVFWYIHQLRNPNLAGNSLWFRGFAFFRWPDFYVLFFVRHLFAEQKMLLFLSKLMSCFFVVGVCRLFETDTYDERLIAIGLVVAALAHSTICGRFHGFEYQQLQLVRNLPWPVWRQAARQLCCYVLILLPEMVLLLFNLPVAVGYDFVMPSAFLLVGLVFWQHQYL